MTWSRRLLPVPTSCLVVDPSIAADSPKGYSSAQLQQIARTVQDVYAALEAGVTDEQLLAARGGPDRDRRATGDTYAHLFGRMPSAQRIAADLTADGLVVDKGNHRVRAAQAAGVEYLPVEVRARTEEELRGVVMSWQEQGGAHYDALLRSHRDVERQARPERAPEPIRHRSDA